MNKENKCPVCGSTNKEIVPAVYKTNDICGPGFRSRKIYDGYYICDGCGVHYGRI